MDCEHFRLESHFPISWAAAVFGRFMGFSAQCFFRTVFVFVNQGSWFKRSI